MSLFTYENFCDEFGHHIGESIVKSDGTMMFRGTDGTNLGTTPPATWRPCCCCGQLPEVVEPPPPSTDWWKSIDIGGTVTGLLSTPPAFPGGPRYAMTPVAGDVSITTPSSTYSTKNVSGKIVVNANNVTINDCQAYAVYITPGYTGTVINYCKIMPPNCWNFSSGAVEAGILYNEFTANYCEITNTFDGVKAFGNVTLDNCWIHDMSCCSDAGNTGGGYPHGDGVQSGGGTGLTITNCAFERTSENSGIFLFRDGAGGYGTNPIKNVTINGVTIYKGGNFGLWIEEANDPGIPIGDKAPQNVSVSNVWLGCADSTGHGNGCTTNTAPTWRGKLQYYMPTTHYTAGTWANVYSLNGTPAPTAIPLVNTGTSVNYCNIGITL